MSQSLTQAKIERWSLTDRIGQLESELWDLREVQRENADLKEQLRVSKMEQDDTVNRFSEMKSRVNLFISREEATRHSIESELSLATEQVQAVSFERERAVQESLRLRTELAMLQQEMNRVRNLLADSVDREFHERMAQDLKAEVEAVRKSFEGSVPQVIHERVVSQMQQTSTKLTDAEERVRAFQCDNNSVTAVFKDKDEQISRLQGQLESSEVRLKTAQAELDALRLHIKELAPTIEDGRKYSLVADALKESMKRGADLNAELARKTDIESSLSSRVIALEKALIEAGRRKHVVDIQVKRLRNDLNAVKSHAESLQASSQEIVQTGIHRIEEKYNMESEEVCSDVYKVMRRLGVVHGEVDKPRSRHELVILLTSTLTALKVELESTHMEAETARLAVGSTRVDLARREAEVRELTMRMSTVAHDRTREDTVLSRLRESIESAEFRMSRHKRFEE